MKKTKSPLYKVGDKVTYSKLSFNPFDEEIESNLEVYEVKKIKWNGLLRGYEYLVSNNKYELELFEEWINGKYNERLDAS